MDIQNFAFIKTINAEALKNAVIFINRTRRHPFSYRRIMQTVSRDGWIALVIHSPSPDHYLLRNVSGRLHTRVFETGSNGFSMYYRTHLDGKTIGAFESHLALWITQQLRALMATGQMTQIDLAEPAGRVILKRYHEYRRAWTASSANESVTPELKRYYAANPDDLKPYVKPNISTKYIDELVKPGFSTAEAFRRIIDTLDMPYISGDPVKVDLTEKSSTPSTTANKSDTDMQQRVLRGAEILTPATWNDDLELPRGWFDITEDQWQSENKMMTATGTLS